MDIQSLTDSAIAILKMLPWSTFITAGISASAVLLGTHFSSKAGDRRIALQFEHEAKARAETLKGEKLEELYSLTKEFIDDISSALECLKPYGKTTVTNHDLNTLRMSYLLKGNKKYQRMLVLRNIYFQNASFERNFTKLITAQDHVLSFVDIEEWNKKVDIHDDELKAAVETVIDETKSLDDAIKLYAIKIYPIESK